MESIHDVSIVPTASIWILDLWLKLGRGHLGIYLESVEPSLLGPSPKGTRKNRGHFLQKCHQVAVIQSMAAHRAAPKSECPLTEPGILQVPLGNTVIKCSLKTQCQRIRMHMDNLSLLESTVNLASWSPTWKLPHRGSLIHAMSQAETKTVYLFLQQCL